MKKSDHKLNKVISCPVCENLDINYFIEKDDYSFDCCSNCEFMFLNPMPNQIALNRIYTDDDTKADVGYKKANSRLRRAFMKLPRFLPYALNKNSLDFGCGGGFVAYALSFIAKSSTGIDINQKAITYAKKRFNSVNFYCNDFHGCPFLANPERWRNFWATLIRGSFRGIDKTFYRLFISTNYFVYVVDYIVTLYFSANGLVR